MIKIVPFEGVKFLTKLEFSYNLSIKKVPPRPNGNVN